MVATPVPPNRTPPVVTVIAHMGIEQTCQKSEHYQATPGEGRVLCAAVRPIDTNDSKRPVPSLKAQETMLLFTGVNSNTWWLGWGAMSKPVPTRRCSPLATPE